MSFVEVAVDAPIGPGRTLSYSVPAGMDVEPGNLVWVPLGSRPVRGIIFENVPQPSVEQARDILSVVGPRPFLTLTDIQLARWISSYYLSSLYEAAALFLPAHFEGQIRSYLRRSSSTVAPSIPGPEMEILNQIGYGDEVEEKALLKSVGTSYERHIRRLVAKGSLVRRWELPKPRAMHRYEPYLRLPLSAHDSAAGFSRLSKTAKRQLALYAHLLETQELVPTTQANKEFGTGAAAALLAKGLIGEEWVRAERNSPIAPIIGALTEPAHILTHHQEKALSRITGSMNDMAGTGKQHLIHGVTGSGKTEVYIRALEHCVSSGKQGIFLVPEIALTPQMVHQLNVRFPGRVAALHSQLTTRQRLDQWWGIKEGKYDVVVGPRSAIFAPVPKLGLVVMDEEHEWAYKQAELAPRYHAREAALKRAELSGAVFVAGSATPDVGTYYRAALGEFALHHLPERIATGLSSKGGSLAQVEVCDMREELKSGNRSIFSRALADALVDCLKLRQQAILYLNRRGSATVIQCRDCGHNLRCRSCSTTLTYHASSKRAICHLCNRRSNRQGTCPSCGSERIRYLGLGTQRVVEELNNLIPGAKALRWDRDTATTTEAHQQILGEYLRGEAQVLVGTQMIAKGLHLPNVTLVGTVLADVGLNLPDFRAGERSFQLLCQVAGRAGRGAAPGRVIIQTYNPDHYAVQSAAAQDYSELYQREISARQELKHPPFHQLIRMVYAHTNFDNCQREAQRLKRTFDRRIAAAGLTDVDVLGPAPAYPEQLRGRYRWHLILRGRNLHSLCEEVDIPHGWTLDVDPVSML